MALTVIDNAIIDAVLRRLAVLNIEGKLDRGRLTSEIESLAAWRGLASGRTLVDRYTEIRREEKPPAPPVPEVLTEDEIAEAVLYGNADFLLHQHDSCLSSIPANHPDRPRLEEQRRRLLRQMVEGGPVQFQD